MKVIFCLFFILASCASQHTKIQRNLANNKENLNFKSILPDKLENQLLCKSVVREYIGRVGFQGDQWKRQVDTNNNLAVFTLNGGN